VERLLTWDESKGSLAKSGNSRIRTTLIPQRNGSRMVRTLYRLIRATSSLNQLLSKK
jgi:hypothetical protein